MIESIDRSTIVATWDDLNDVIGDYQRGRLEKSAVFAAYREYRNACDAIGEGKYKLANILNDDMPDIDFLYPSEKPYFQVDSRGYWITPHSIEQVEAANRLLNNR